MNLTSTSTSSGETHSSSIFNPARLQLARIRRGFTQTALASAMRIDRRSIVGYESGEYAPSDESVLQLSQVLEFPVTFFFAPDPEIPEPDAISFRALSKMRAAQKNMAVGQGGLALDLNGWIEQRFNLPLPDLPDLSSEPDPESAAMALRYAWGRGEAPIKNVLHLMESRGVRVFSLSIESREVDAFSMWKGDTPLVFLNTQKTSERSRFDAAHELGHLVMHRHAHPGGREAEREANAFASAFLMPQKSVIARAPRIPTLARLIECKQEWNVSVAALTYRMHQLGLMTEWTYRSLFQEINRLGYMTNEPASAPRETSLILGKVMAALIKDGITKAELASKLAVYERELDQLIFGLIITSHKGGKSTVNPQGGGPKPKLRLVGK